MEQQPWRRSATQLPQHVCMTGDSYNDIKCAARGKATLNTVNNFLLTSTKQCNVATLGEILVSQDGTKMHRIAHFSKTATGS